MSEKEAENADFFAAVASFAAFSGISFCALIAVLLANLCCCRADRS